MPSSCPLELEKQTPSPTSTAGGALPVKLLKHAHDADEALKVFEEGGVLHVDEATNKRLLKKIDLNVMPLLCVVYGLNYLDKTTLSYASVMGIKEDINLTGDDYQWLGSMFYFGQALPFINTVPGVDSWQATLHGNIQQIAFYRCCLWRNTLRSALSCGAWSFVAWPLSKTFRGP